MKRIILAVGTVGLLISVSLGVAGASVSSPTTHRAHVTAGPVTTAAVPVTTTTVALAPNPVPVTVPAPAPVVTPAPAATTTTTTTTTTTVAQTTSPDAVGLAPNPDQCLLSVDVPTQPGQTQNEGYDESLPMDCANVAYNESTFPTGTTFTVTQVS